MGRAGRVVVIGSGPVGAVYARLLVESGSHVTMIDSGTIQSDPPGEHLGNAKVFQQTPNLFMDVTAARFETFSTPPGIFSRWRRSKYRRNYENPKQKLFRNMPFASAVYAVGGMSTIWTASCPRHTDFELPSVIPVDEWRELLDVADHLLAVSTETFDASPVGEAILDQLNGRNGREYHQLPVAASPGDAPGTVRWTGSAVVLGPLLEDETYAERFEIRPEHRAEELVHGNGVVTAVKVRDLISNNVTTLEADAVVVAAGSFLTPRLLWQSGITPDALGHYLHDHTQSGVRVSMSKKMLKRLRGELGNPAREDPLPIAQHATPPMIGVEPTEAKPWHGQIHGSGKKFIYTGGEDVRRMLDMSYYGMVTPRYKNHISFSETLEDRFGQPQITIHFRWSWGDVWRMIRMWWDMIRTAKKLGKLKSIPIISPPGTTLHLMGTYRMGTEATREESVTDTDSRVWGFDNLYLGGLGLIPEPNASNPTNVACAMAVKGASALTERSLDELRAVLVDEQIDLTAVEQRAGS